MTTIYYSTYRWMVAILYIVFEGALAAVAFSYSAAFGVVIVLMFTLMGIIVLWINFHGTKLGLEGNFGHYRNPMLFSRTYMVGLEIVDENYSGPPKPESFEGTTWDNGSPLGSSPAFVRCAFCHAIVGIPDSKLCPECGRVLQPRVSPVPV